MANVETSIPISESYWIIPGRFIAGEYPGSLNDDEARCKLRWLLDQNIDLILDLTEDGEAGLRPYANIFFDEAAKIPRKVNHQRLPLRDFQNPAHETLSEILNTIDLSLSEGKSIYLHCFGGKGRTGTVVGCYLVRHGMTGQEALEKIRELRKFIPGRDEQSPETVGQKRMVLEWKLGQ